MSGPMTHHARQPEREVFQKEEHVSHVEAGSARATKAAIRDVRDEFVLIRQSIDKAAIHQRHRLSRVVLVRTYQDCWLAVFHTETSEVAGCVSTPRIFPAMRAPTLSQVYSRASATDAWPIRCMVTG